MEFLGYKIYYKVDMYFILVRKDINNSFNVDPIQILQNLIKKFN